jgi:hypothetical protein
MIDNIELIKPLLNFENDGDFYMLYIFKRKKDQPEGERDNHQSVRTIKTYCVESIEYLEKRYDEIKTLCEVFNARAYIHVQKQNHFDVSMDMIIEVARRVKSKQFNQNHIFDSIVGKLQTLEKRWIVDIDTKDTKELFNVQLHIDSCRPFGIDKIEKIIPTKSGYHLITKKFDVLEFKKKYPKLDIHKKNPTILYIPNSLY